MVIGYLYNADPFFTAILSPNIMVSQGTAYYHKANNNSLDGHILYTRLYD